MDVLDAWLNVIARDGWAAARLGAVTDLASAGASSVAEQMPDRWSALQRYGERLDRAALAEVGTDRTVSVRDQLFAMFMERFDAAQAQRAAAQALAVAARRDPGLAVFMLATLGLSIARIADAAGVKTTGWFGPARVQMLTLLYLQVSRTWLEDKSADLAATMKALDTQLARAESFASYFSGVRSASLDDVSMDNMHVDGVTAVEGPRSAGDPALE